MNELIVMLRSIEVICLLVMLPPSLRRIHADEHIDMNICIHIGHITRTIHTEIVAAGRHMMKMAISPIFNFLVSPKSSYHLAIPLMCMFSLRPNLSSDL